MLRAGFEPEAAEAVATLYYEAFEGKLSTVLGGRARATAYLKEVLDPSHALCAVSRDGREVLGVAGFKTASGSLSGGFERSFFRHYGYLGGILRAAALALLERSADPDHLLMDGIAVARTARGQGIGSALLAGIEAEALRRGLSAVRLDVVDTNPRARALYLRCGYKPGASTRLGLFRHLFGFDKATEMIKPL